MYVTTVININVTKMYVTGVINLNVTKYTSPPCN